MDIRQSRFNIATALVLALSASHLPACSNPAPIGSPGTSLLPLELNRMPGIAIADESLTIKDGAKSSLPSFAPGGNPMEVDAVEYQATYRFENRTGKEKTIEVGFPVVTYIHQAGDSLGGLSSFGITFGAKTIQHKELSRSTPTLYPKADLKEIAGDLVLARLGRPVPEAPDFLDLNGLGKSAANVQRRLKGSGKFSISKVDRIVRVLNETVFGDGDWAVKQQSLVWYAFDLKLPPGLSPALKVRYVSIAPVGENELITYLLRTAKYWGGPIGRLQVTFEPDEAFVKNGGSYELSPKSAFRKAGRRYTHTALQAIPKFDVQIKKSVH